MKKLLFSLIAGLALTFSVEAQQAPTFDIHVAWDANPVTDAVTHYTLYKSVGLNGAFEKVADVTTTTGVYAGLTPGIYRFAVTASNVWGESDQSGNIVTPGGRPIAPSRFLTVRIVPSGQ